MAVDTCTIEKERLSYVDFFFHFSLQERKIKDAQMRATINQKLVETGERER